MSGAATWLLLTFLITPKTPEGAISMDSAVIGISRIYESEKSCHAGAGQIQLRLMKMAEEEKGKIAMVCVQGWVYEPKD